MSLTVNTVPSVSSFSLKFASLSGRHSLQVVIPLQDFGSAAYPAKTMHKVALQAIFGFNKLYFLLQAVWDKAHSSDRIGHRSRYG